MEVAREACRGHAHLVIVEVVARREVDVPPVGDADVSAEVERLRELVGVAHPVVVELAFCVLAHGDAIADSERPRHVEAHVAVGVGFGHATSALLCAVLAALHVVIDVRLDVGVQSLVVFVFLLTVFAAAASEPLLEFLGIDREREVLAHTLEAGQTAVAPLGMVADVGFAVFVQLVGVGGKLGVDGEGVVLPPLQAQPHAQIAPAMVVGGRIVAHVEAQLVDDADLAVACGVFVALDLHLDVVAHVPGDHLRLVASRDAVEFVLVGGVLHEAHLAVGVGVLVTIVVAVAARAKVRCIGERHLRRDDMADGLDLVAEDLLARCPESIYLRTGCQRQAPVIDVVEAVDGVGALLRGRVVPGPVDLLGVHAVGEAQRGCDVDDVEEREVGLHGNGVLQSVAPVVDEVGVEQLVLLRGDAVAHLARVADGDLLVPAFLASSVLAAEGVESGDAHIEVWQGERDDPVAHVLREVGRGAERHADGGEARAVADGRGACRLGQRLRVVHRVEVVALITRCGEVDARRELAEGTGLRVLAMVPLDLEALLLGVVGHSLVACLRVLITEVERSVVTVSPAVVAGRAQAPAALRVDLAEQLQVPLVADGEVVASVAEIEAAVILLAIGGHDEARTVFLGEREEAVGDGEGQGHVGHDQIGGTEDHVLARTYLGTREGDVEVGVWIVARRVASVLEIDGARGVALADLASHKAVILSGIDATNETLLRLEVVGHRVALILRVAQREDGAALNAVLRRAVLGARGAHQGTVEVHIDLVGGELHVLIIDLRITEEACGTAYGVIDNGVFGGELHGGVNALATGLHDAVGTERIVDMLVEGPDGSFETVQDQRVCRKGEEVGCGVGS